MQTQPWESTPIWLAGFALLTVVVNSFVSILQSYFQHKESMGKLHEVKENVDGKMDQLLKIQGNAREAIGNLAGKAEQKAIQEYEHGN